MGTKVVSISSPFFIHINQSCHLGHVCLLIHQLNTSEMMGQLVSALGISDCSYRTFWHLNTELTSVEHELSDLSLWCWSLPMVW